jgi:hypothetical protein
MSKLFEDKEPLHPNNKVYSLTPKFITDLVAYYRKIRLKRYKQRKIKSAKTSFDRNFFIKFKIKLDDEINSQISDLVYEMVVPAKATYFAKLYLERDIKRKISVEVIDVEELSDDEHEELMTSREEYVKNKN